MVERPGQRDDAAGAHASVGRFESNDVAVACRLANRTSSVGTDRAITELRCNSRRRAAGRAAWAVIEIPRIVNRAEITDCRAATVGELMQVELAKEHRTGSFQAAHNLCVLDGNAVCKYAAGCGGAHASGIYQVF